MKTKIKVLIAGAGGGGVGVEVMKALRLLGPKYVLYAADMSPLSFGLHLADKGFLVPPATSRTYVSSLLSVCRKEKIRVLIPGSDPDLKAISLHQARFEAEHILAAVNSPQVIRIGLDKIKTMQTLKDHDFRVPQTVLVQTQKDISKVHFFPCVIKPRAGSGGSKFTFVAQDRKELEFFCAYSLKYGQKPLVQSYIGSADAEYTIGVLSDRSAKILSTVGIRRFIKSGLSNRFSIAARSKKGGSLCVSSGLTQGEIIFNQAILKEAGRIAAALGSRGPLNIQGRWAGGRLYTFEINPRFSGTTYMRALAGVNEPDLWIDHHVLGRPLPHAITLKPGTILRGLYEKFIPEKKSFKTP